MSSPLHVISRRRSARQGVAAAAVAGAFFLGCGAAADTASAPTDDAVVETVETSGPTTTIELPVAPREVGGTTATDGDAAPTDTSEAPATGDPGAAPEPTPIVEPRERGTSETSAAPTPIPAPTSDAPAPAPTTAPVTAQPPTSVPPPPPTEPTIMAEGLAVLRDANARSGSATPAMCGTSAGSLVVIFGSDPDDAGVTVGADLIATGFAGPGTYVASGIVLVTPPGEEPMNLIVTGDATMDEDGSGRLVIAHDSGDAFVSWVCSI